MGGRGRVITGSAVAGTLILIGLFVAVLVLRLGPTAGRIAPLPYLTVAAMDLLPVAALGSILLAVAAARARSHTRAVGLGLVVCASSVAIGMVWDVTVASSGWSAGALLVVAYWLGLAAVAASGVSLSRSLLPPEDKATVGLRVEDAGRADEVPVADETGDRE